MAIDASSPTRRDPAAAMAATRTLDRVMWQRISADGSHGVVAGIRHRRPAYLTVTMPVALGLREAGIPTVVSGEGQE